MKADGSILQSNMNVFCNLIDGLEPGACPLLLPNGLKAVEPNTRTLLMLPVTQGVLGQILKMQQHCLTLEHFLYSSVGRLCRPFQADGKHP